MAVNHTYHMNTYITKDHTSYRIRVNKPPAVYKKIKVLSWWFIEIFPKFDQKSPKKWTFWVKKWWFI